MPQDNMQLDIEPHDLIRSISALDLVIRTANDALKNTDLPIGKRCEYEQAKADAQETHNKFLAFFDDYTISEMFK